MQLNKLGMEYLSQGDFKQAYMKLKYAERVIQAVEVPSEMHQSDHEKLYSLTINNLGCYYKKVFKPNVALKYLKQALKNEI